MFVESYGQMAVQGTSFSPGIDEVVNAGTQQLQADGFSSRSGWLVSSTFGGGSWLAHATLQSGVWVNSPGRYSALIASQRLTLASAFRRAGWRTVADVPATHGAWPEGSVLLPLREDLGPRQPRVSRPEIRLLPDAGPVRAPGAAEARAGEAKPPACLLRDRSHLEPRALDAHSAAHLLGPARQRIDLQSPTDRPGRPDRHPAGIRPVDSVRPARSLFVHRALRQQEHRADRAGRPPTVKGRSAAHRGTRCRSRSSPTTRM